MSIVKALSSYTPFFWVKNMQLRLLVLITISLRLMVTLAWPFEFCVRDECMYMNIADRMSQGLGMTASNGWIWAPGYPALLALHKLVTSQVGTIEVTQAFISGIAALLLFSITRRVYPDPGRERPAYVAAWLYGLSPTFIFFSASMWSEVFYGFFLLLAIHRALVASQALDETSGEPLLFQLRQLMSAPWFRASILAGILVGLCVLLRGVATYMLPIFAFGLLWRRFRSKTAWVAAGLLFLSGVLTVAPYSAYASHKFKAFVITDRTLGQMMWLGDNEYPPITFDWGNGELSEDDFEDHVSDGRPHCAGKRNPIERDNCETAAGKKWIRENPGEFLRRVPLRLAQTYNPHSFLTRHLRQGRWHGFPGWGRELLCALVVGWSFVTVLGGALGVWTRRGGFYRVIVVLTLLYHLAAIGCVAGLTRYRVPLDMVWMPFAAVFLASPLQALRELSSSVWRIVGTLLTFLILASLLLWFLPAGFPWWRSW